MKLQLVLLALLTGCSGPSFSASDFQITSADGASDSGVEVSDSSGDTRTSDTGGSSGSGGDAGGAPSVAGSPGAGGIVEHGSGGHSSGGVVSAGGSGSGGASGGAPSFPPVQCSDPGPCANTCKGPSGFISPCCYYVQPGGPSTWQSCGCPAFDAYGNERGCAP